MASERSVGNPLVHPFNVYSIREGEKNAHLGGAYDNASAIQIAAAVFIAAQGQGAAIPLIFVYDDSDQVIAFIGETEEVLDAT